MKSPNTLELSPETRLESVINQLSELREVTYAYLPVDINDTEEGNFNMTLFFRFHENEQEKQKTTEQYKQKLTDEKEKYKSPQEFFEKIKIQTESELKRIINEFETLKMHFSNNPDTLAIIENNLAAANFSYHSVIPELSKAGYEHGLSESEKLEIHQKLNYCDAKLFAPNVMQNPRYIEDTYTYIKHLATKYKDAIGDEKYQKMQDFLNLLEEKGKSKIDTNAVYEDDKKFEDPIMQVLGKYKMPREHYARVFRLYNQVAKVPQEVNVGAFSSFSDKDDAFGIPESDTYAEKSLREILTIPPHETTHYVNYKETVKAKNKKRPGDMIKEEGLASILEKALAGIPPEKMNYIGVGFPPVVFSQIISGGEYNTFTEIYNELLYLDGARGSIADTQTSVYRKKRGYFLDIPGGSMKDATYSIGKEEVAQYLMEGLPLKCLYGGKISMEDVRSKQFEASDFGIDQLSPFLVASFVKFALQNRDSLREGRRNAIGKIKEKHKNLDSETVKIYIQEASADWDLHKNFVAYIKDTYPFFAPYFDTIQESEVFSRLQKQKVGEILGIYKKSIPAHEDFFQNKKPA